MDPEQQPSLEASATLPPQSPRQQEEFALGQTSAPNAMEVETKGSEGSSPIVTLPAPALAPAATTSPAAAGPKPGKADAEAYLNDVKKQFADQPQVYHDFVDLMKSFKAGSITTQNIIELVAKLFYGFPDLIDRFNQFSGYKPATAGGTEQVLSQQYYAPPSSSTSAAAAAAAYSTMAPTAPQQSQQQQALPQFDHAIHYVTRIKKRFMHDPDTYKLFLDILHTYQKESKSVNDVLSQVSELFRDHPDLLKDFTYFLPDGAQSQAKEEIQRLTARRKKETKPAKPIKPLGKRAEKAAAIAAATAAAASNTTTTTVAATSTSFPLDRSGSPIRRRLIDEREDESYQQIQQQQPMLPKPVDRSALSTLLLAANRLPRIEEDLFGKIKSALGTRAKWGEFVRCVELFSNETLSRQEFIALVVDLLQFAPELVNELDRVLAARGVTDEMQEEGWFSVPLSEIDFTHCAHPTPSYHCLPERYPKPMCSERTKLCRQVLNDTHVAVAIDVDFGSRGRVNPFEDQLFKVEDDRFEMEMLIEANKSTTYLLEQMLLETNPCFKRFSTIHLKAISRMLGEEGTLEAFESLKKCPLLAIPTLLERLKSTLVEMELQKIKLQQMWAQMDLKNYAKSKDHRSSTFKRDDPKQQLSLRTHLLELKDCKPEGMLLDFAACVVHRYAFELVSCVARRVLDIQEMQLFTQCFHLYIAQVFGLTSLGGKEVVPKPGSQVWGKLGRGEMQGKRVKLVPSGEVVDLATAGDLYEYIPFTGPAATASTVNQTLFLGRNGYFFLRYYHVLCTRLALAMDKITEVKFGDFLTLAVDYASGQVDYSKFEEKVKLWMGKHFYVMMTLDKLLEETYKTFQNQVDEDKVNEVLTAQRAVETGDSALLVNELFRSAQDALAIKSPTGTAACVKLVRTTATSDGSTLHLLFPDAIPQILTLTSVQAPIPVLLVVDQDEEQHVLSVFSIENFSVPIAAKELYEAHLLGTEVTVDWWKLGNTRSASAEALAVAGGATIAMTTDNNSVSSGPNNNNQASYSPLPDLFNESEEEGGSNSAAPTAATHHSNSMLSPRIKRLRTED
ncbi:hypothetical protein BASA81_007388 [Batrachochytrium salamandrivorans]|nr:hypothetical protein BASA81_007388 [Batrachochytrium salamandrivorans]